MLRYDEQIKIQRYKLLTECSDLLDFIRDRWSPKDMKIIIKKKNDDLDLVSIFHKKKIEISKELLDYILNGLIDEIRKHLED